MSARDSLRILTIGNSFTDSLTACFPQVAASAGCALRLDRANFGGCELRRHWSYMEAEEAFADCRIYQGGSRKLRRILADEPWDVVTIQQASHESWRPETFQPYADRIAAYVRRHAPGAELVIQQTWSYRSDDPRLLPGGEWGIDQEEMYRRLTENYRRLAQNLGVRMIPTGDAVQLARRAQGDRAFCPYPQELLQTLRWPDLPPQAGAVVGRCFWERDEGGHWRLRRDLIHLNCRGQYLQACVWFAFLFERPVAEITWVSENLDVDDAAFLRAVAAAAVAGRESL